MGCYLRLHGTDLDVDYAMRVASPMRVVSTYVRGAPRNIVRSEPCDASGLVIEISDTGFDDFERQVADATKFLESFRKVLDALRACPGLDQFGIDFGVSDGDNGTPHLFLLPSDLIRRAAEVGLSIEISVYPVKRM